MSIDNPGKELKANMTANAEIVLAAHPNSLLQPEMAIVYDGKKPSFVDLVDPAAKSGRRRVPVTLGVGSGSRNQSVEKLRANRQAGG